MRTENHSTYTGIIFIANINIYDKTNACVSYVLEKMKDEMKDTTLRLIGFTGLKIFDQFGTKGNTSI